MSFFSKLIGLETVPGEVADVNPRERMKFASNSVLRKILKFVSLGLSPANTANKLNSVFASTTRAEGLTDKSDWLTYMHGCIEVTVGIVSKAKTYSDYIKNSDFETREFLEWEIFLGIDKLKIFH